MELRLTGAAAQLNSIVAQAEHHGWTHKQFFLAVLEAEINHRRTSSGRRLVSVVHDEQQRAG